MTATIFLLTLSAQDQTAPQPPQQRPRETRRFNFGFSMSLHALPYMEKKTSNSTLGSDTTVKSTNENLGNRFAYGPAIQFQFAGRWGLASGLHLRTGEYRVTNETTINSKTSKTKERTSFRSWEVPVMVRRFSKAHDEAGWRWFAQAGFSARGVHGVRTELESTATDGKITCCESTPAVPKQKAIFGFVTGAGITARDQFGIRFTPEVRYTRWVNRNWDRLTARTSRDQAEIVLAFTF